MGPRFESVKVHQWPVGQVVKTAASHAVNIGSNPVRVTISFHEVKRNMKTPLTFEGEELIIRLYFSWEVKLFS